MPSQLKGASHLLCIPWRWLLPHTQEERRNSCCASTPTEWWHSRPGPLHEGYLVLLGALWETDKSKSLIWRNIQQKAHWTRMHVFFSKLSSSQTAVTHLCDWVQRSQSGCAGQAYLQPLGSSFQPSHPKYSFSAPVPASAQDISYKKPTMDEN